MEENSGDNNSGVMALDVERAHDSDGDVSVEGDHYDDEVVTKTMVSNHPMFGLLIQTHIKCLKIGLGHDFDDEDFVVTASNTMAHEANESKLNESSLTSIPTSPELDKFMEAYFLALNKLKEAIAEPLQDATSFITNMYGQLNDLNMIKNSDEDCQTLVLNHDKECEQPDLA